MARDGNHLQTCVEIRCVAETVYRSRWYPWAFKTLPIQILLIILLTWLAGHRVDWVLPELLAPLSAQIAYVFFIGFLPEIIGLASSSKRIIATLDTEGLLVLDLEERHSVPFSELQGISIASCGLFSTSARVSIITPLGTESFTTSITSRALFRFIHAIEKRAGSAEAEA